MSLLILRNLLKTFGGLVAMNSVTFSVDEASIVGLIGPNGAGKTTTFNIITGNYRPDSGEVIFDRKDYRGPPTRSWIGHRPDVPEHPGLFQDMSVLENVLAGCHCRMRRGCSPPSSAPPRSAARNGRPWNAPCASLPSSGWTTSTPTLRGTLPTATSACWEIARALASEPRFLILDEPAGGMTIRKRRISCCSQGHPEAGHHHPADRARHEPCHARLRKDRRAGKRGPHRRRHFRRDQEKPEGHRGLPRRGRLEAVDATEGTSCFPGAVHILNRRAAPKRGRPGSGCAPRPPPPRAGQGDAPKESYERGHHLSGIAATCA